LENRKLRGVKSHMSSFIAGEANMAKRSGMSLARLLGLISPKIKTATVITAVETVAPGEEVPSVTVPVPGSDDIKVEENVEGEVVKTENEDGSITTSQTTQTVTEKKDETTGSVTNVETITTTETVKSPEKEQLEDGDVMTETTTTTTIEKTTEETENGETSESVKVTVNVTEDTTEIVGDVKEGEDDAEYDYTISTETTEREVELEITDNGVKLEDVATGLVGEQEVVLKGLDPVYDETDNWKDGGDSYPGQPDDAAGKLGLYDRNYLSSETMDYVTMGDIIIWLNDSSKIITDIYVPEGSELPEDFAYSVGSNVSSWFDGTDPKQSKLPAGMNVGKNNVAINNIETWYNADGDLILNIP